MDNTKVAGGALGALVSLAVGYFIMYLVTKKACKDAMKK